jgi:hypothetical protein
MNDWGFKIAETGFDVKTCGDQNLVYSSAYPQLKKQSSGSGSHTFTNNQGTLEIAEHNLGYRPFFAVWVDTGSGYELATFGGQSGDFYVGYMPTATTEKLFLVAVTTYNGGFWGDPTPLPDKTIDYSWVIFYDPIEDE